MIGSNKLMLNEASLIKAMQHYFDTVIFAHEWSPEVTGVRSVNDAGSVVFEINIKQERSRDPVKVQTG